MDPANLQSLDEYDDWIVAEHGAANIIAAGVTNHVDHPQLIGTTYHRSLEPAHAVHYSLLQTVYDNTINRYPENVFLQTVMTNPASQVSTAMQWLSTGELYITRYNQNMDKLDPNGNLGGCTHVHTWSHEEKKQAALAAFSAFNRPVDFSNTVYAAGAPAPPPHDPRAPDAEPDHAPPYTPPTPIPPAGPIPPNPPGADPTDPFAQLGPLPSTKLFRTYAGLCRQYEPWERALLRANQKKRKASMEAHLAKYGCPKPRRVCTTKFGGCAPRSRKSCNC